MRQDERGPFVAALRAAREAAFPAGEFVGQESFMRASEIRSLAHRARIRPDVAVLDLCCGVAGPGRLIAVEFGCGYVGVDYSASAIRLASELAGELPCRFEQRHVPPVPDGPFEVVLLLEAMLAFPDKRALLQGVARALQTGGRFACTVEAGRPLSATERGRMPDADTVCLIGVAELITLLHAAGLTVIQREECTAAHQAMAETLLRSFRAHSAEIAEQIGTTALAELLTAHELWTDWLASGRVRKFALVAEKR